MSALLELLDHMNQTNWVPCKNLRKITVGERVKVNWYPVGETRLATAVSFTQHGLLVRLDHNDALLEIQGREQVNWDQKRHSKAR